jgi:hypothetical protein
MMGIISVGRSLWPETTPLTLPIVLAEWVSASSGGRLSFAQKNSPSYLQKVEKRFLSAGSLSMNKFEAQGKEAQWPVIYQERNRYLF